MDPLLFSQLNSPDYYSVYPPINQGMYYLSFKLGGAGLGFVIVLKCLFLIVEGIGMYYATLLLTRLDLALTRGAWYYLNPLVIIEGMGNLHIEVVAVTGIVLTLYYLCRQQYIRAGAAYAVAIACKIVPLLIAPILALNSAIKRRKQFIIATVLGVALAFSPLVWMGEATQFGHSLDLYFRKFEFNGSLYYALRFIGYKLEGYNLIASIGPAMSIIVVVTIFYLVYARRQMSPSTWVRLISTALMGWTIYLLLSTTVHPWYIIPPLFLAICTPYRFLFLWSFLIMLTYINYSYATYHENLWVVALEYFIVGGMMIYEGFFRKEEWLPGRYNS